MRPIHTTKRLYSIAASPPLKSAVRPTPTSPRPRRASLSLASAVTSSSSSGPSNVVGSPGSRSLYSNASGLHYFESGGVPPPPPPPTSRPGSSSIASSSRLSLGEAQSQSQNVHHNGSGNGSSTNSAQSPHSPHTSNGSQLTQQTSHGQSQHGQTSGGQQAEGQQPNLGSSSLMLSFGGPAPPPGSSPPDHNLLLNGPRSSLAANSTWRLRDPVSDTTDKSAKEEDNVSAVSAKANRKLFQLEVGAYGIPKRGRGVARGRNCVCPTCLEEEEAFSLEFLDGAVQVGEDAYFIRDDALGVADGVGGWGSRNSSSRISSAMHSCSICTTASSSKIGHHVQSHRQHLHRPRTVQPSPSALFARRLMHFCAHEVGEARAASVTARPGNRSTAERESEPVTVGAKPSLRHGGIVTRPGRQKTVVRDFGNARPFVWPWDNGHEHANGLEALVEEDVGEKYATPSNEIMNSAFDDASNAEPTPDPLEGTIDPVDVLERAYSKTIGAHRVRRRVRVIKEQKATPRWWSYGLGLGSSTPSSSITSLRETIPTEREKLEDYEWEWQESWEPLTVGSSTALLAVLSGDRLRVAHLGDCVGWLVRAGEIVWRSEEMWWGFNYPVQLGPSSPTRPVDARRYEISVQADDILILASDGVSDNCWEEDVLDEVRRAVEVHLPLAQDSQATERKAAGTGATTDLLGRRTLAGMLSEALCSRARQLSMQSHGVRRAADMKKQVEEEEELPFERRAREEGRSFRGGKADDISVLVAIISPVRTGTGLAASEMATNGHADSISSTGTSPATVPMNA